MKKTKIFSLTALLLSLGMAGCSSDNPQPEGPTMVYGADDKIHWLENEETGEIDRSTRADHKFVAYAGDSRHSNKEATCSETGESFERCSDCGYIRTVTVEKKDHTYQEDATKAVAPTCGAAGSKTEKCSVCGDEKQTPVEKTGNHTFGTATEVHSKVDGTLSKLSKKTCTACTGGVDFIVDAMSYTTKVGNNKDSSGATLKFEKNDNYAEYKFNVDKAYAGCKVALFGYIDCYNDGQNENQNKGFKVNGSATFSVEVNGALVDITNDKTFAEMGMTEGANHNGNAMLCYLGGTADLVSGSNTIKYTRLASYNLNISEIHFIY